MPTETAPATPAAPATSQLESPNGFKASATGAWGPLGGTFAFARDDQNTSITFGPAQGFGFFGSVGQGAAASQTSAQAGAQVGLGPVGGSLTAGTAGVTATGTYGVPINPGMEQTTTYSGTLNNDGSFTSTRAEGYGFGLGGTGVGAVTTQTISISVSNETLNAIGNAFSAVANYLGLSGPSTSTGPPGSEIGGPIPTD